MVFDVELTMFRHGEIRQVTVPDEELTNSSHDLELIFWYGQNDVQPQIKPSVSMGDIIQFQGKRFLIMARGYEEIGPDEKMPTDTVDRLRRVLNLSTEQENEYKEITKTQKTTNKKDQEKGNGRKNRHQRK